MDLPARGGARRGLALGIALAAILLALGVGGGLAALSSAQTTCEYPQTVQTVTFSASRYPNLHQHYLDAVGKGWPKILVLDRDGAATRREKLLAPIPLKTGFDRDEYPPASDREGWLADVEYVPSSENRSQGASLGHQLSGYCNGTRFTYSWGP